MGYYTRSLDVALEYLAKAGQGVDTLLNAGTTRVVQTDAGCTHLHALVHHLAYFLSHGFRQRTTVNGEILCKHIYQTAIDGTAAGYHTVAQKLFLLHAEVVATVELEHIHFFERTLVEQEFDAFASRGLAFGMLFFNSLLAATEAGLLAKLNELFNLFQLFTHNV